MVRRGLPLPPLQAREEALVFAMMTLCVVYVAGFLLASCAGTLDETRHEDVCLMLVLSAIWPVIGIFELVTEGRYEN